MKTENTELEEYERQLTNLPSSFDEDSLIHYDILLKTSLEMCKELNIDTPTWWCTARSEFLRLRYELYCQLFRQDPFTSFDDVGNPEYDYEDDDGEEDDDDLGSLLDSHLF